MSLKDRISKKIDVYLDPEVSTKKMIDSLDKSGVFDMKAIKIILIEIIDYLDSKKK